MIYQKHFWAFVIHVHERGSLNFEQVEGKRGVSSPWVRETPQGGADYVRVNLQLGVPEGQSVRNAHATKKLIKSMEDALR